MKTYRFCSFNHFDVFKRVVKTKKLSYIYYINTNFKKYYVAYGVVINGNIVLYGVLR